jgi:hypothetical protein
MSTAELRLYLSHPRLVIASDEDNTGWTRRLIFEEEGIAFNHLFPINISREVPNDKIGTEFSTSWQTKDITKKEERHYNIVTVDATLDEHPNSFLVIDRSLAVHVGLYLPFECFNTLIGLDWNRQGIELSIYTDSSLEDVKFAISDKDKDALRAGFSACWSASQEVKVRSFVINISKFNYHQPEAKPVAIWQRLFG